jgi:cysteine synthase
MYRLTSSARLDYVSFDSISDAEAFLAARKLSQETVCLVHIASGAVVFTRSYN